MTDVPSGQPTGLPEERPRLRALTTTPRSRTAHEYVREVLRSAVLGGTLRSGQRLAQTEIAEQLGVSTTPVREALRDLATEGLVVFDPHRGALVKSLDIDVVRELYELRITLEPLMVRRVIAAATPDQLARAEELQKRMEAISDTGPWSALNRDFHTTLNEAQKGTRLSKILDGLRDSATPYVALSLSAGPSHVEQSNIEHAELLSLYRKKAVEEAVELTLAHLKATLAVIEQAHERGTF
ncbi:MAG: GntR family transcriptional regulator [Nocardiopsaceae bacterium]|jgi:DNA-binding GntR family transcriptional regulator|nr:GntR family transcriptional regulator [Nocardiopsaceae bacterium]